MSAPSNSFHPQGCLQSLRVDAACRNTRRGHWGSSAKGKADLILWAVPWFCCNVMFSQAAWQCRALSPSCSHPCSHTGVSNHLTKYTCGWMQHICKLMGQLVGVGPADKLLQVGQPRSTLLLVGPCCASWWSSLTRDLQITGEGTQPACTGCCQAFQMGPPRGQSLHGCRATCRAADHTPAWPSMSLQCGTLGG